MAEQAKPAGLEEFDRGWLEAFEGAPFRAAHFGLVGLTRLGEHPAELERLAAIVGPAHHKKGTKPRRTS
ncbi:hypothetical protein [Qaidamihabitans albus]|uniref:hypothetical protein n=1 Tax=Qaidamihabitans albus TaxID=2795733 RepID=UPI0018F1FD61|nr:hypothetical protein [Qaidamihabitans albus]